MTLFSAKSERRILPRWRDSGRIDTSADLQSLKPQRSITYDTSAALPALTQQFNLTPNLGTAAEVISAALLTRNREVAADAAEFVLSRGDEAPKTLRLMASGLVTGEQPFRPHLENDRVKVAQTRQLLRLYPNNPVLWSDLARHHAVHGDRGRAKRCMQVALSLAPDHRWMLRTAARFMVHHGDPIAAQQLLIRHPKTRSDPWLLAAELACAQVAGRAPKYWRQAKDVVRASSLPPRHLSEIATAVAMMELESGARKQARRLVHKGLVDPTENTLAQVFWATENRHLNDGFGLDSLVRKLDDAYEADYRLSITDGDIDGALKSARVWHDDEPFAARPCVEIAYVATLLDDYQTTLDMEERVRTIDGQAPVTLELNAVYAELSSGGLSWEKDATRLERVRTRLLSLMEQEGSDPYHAIADWGLWNYRYGDQRVGYEAYQSAISTALRLRQNEAAAAAAIFAAREAILAGDPAAPNVLQKARDLMAKSTHRACEFYLRKVEALVNAPENARLILTPQSAGQFMKRPEPKVPKVRFEITKAGATIWVPKNGSR